MKRTPGKPQHLEFETRMLNLMGVKEYALRLASLKDRLKTHVHPTTSKRNRFLRRIMVAEKLLRAAKFVEDGTGHIKIRPPESPVEVRVNVRGYEPMDAKTAQALGHLFKAAHSRISSDQRQSGK